MNHPNIVQLYEFYEEPKHYCLVQELLTGGDLLDAILKSGNFSELDSKKIIKKLLLAMNYCH